MANNVQTAQDIAARLRQADEEEFAVLERSLAADTRKTVRAALNPRAAVCRSGGGACTAG